MAPFRKFKKKTSKVSKAVKRYVTKQIDREAETKIYAANSTTFPLVATGVIFNMTNAIAKGADGNQRIGDAIRMHKLYFNYYHLGNAAQITPQVVRLILYQDNQNEGSGIAVPSDIIVNNVPEGVHNSNNMLTKRFKILFDDYYVIGADVYSAQDHHVRKRTIMLNSTARWAFTGTASKGQIYLYVVTQAVTGGASNLTFDWMLEYTDA